MATRRSILLGAAFGTATPALVKAESMVQIPGDPLTKLGLLAASKWATTEFRETPGCRLAFADGTTTRWHHYESLRRPASGEKPGSVHKTEAVAIEVCVTDAAGRRFVTSVPVDTGAVESLTLKRMDALRRQWRGDFW